MLESEHYDYGFPLLFTACLGPLGMASGDITNRQIEASSNANSASKLRLSDSVGWSAAAGDSSPWMKIQFLSVMKVTGVIVKGGVGSNGWVTEYALSYNTPLAANPIEYVDSSTGFEKVIDDNDTSSLNLSLDAEWIKSRFSGKLNVSLATL